MFSKMFNIAIPFSCFMFITCLDRYRIYSYIHVGFDISLGNFFLRSEFPESEEKRRNIDLLYDDSIEPLEIEYFKRPAEDLPEQVVPVFGKKKTTDRDSGGTQTSPRSQSRSEGIRVDLPKLRNINVRCDGCDLTFTDDEMLMRHTPSSNQRPCIFKCKICPDVFDESVGYIDHMLEHLLPLNPRYRNQKILRLRCAICERMFLQEYLLEQHLKVHKTRTKKG